MAVTINIEEAIKILSRYDNQHYTPKTRKAHRMAIEAILKLEEIKNQNIINEENNNENY